MSGYPSMMEPESILSLGGEDPNSIMYMGDPMTLKDNIHKNVIGHAQKFRSPFGTKQILYCDYIASGRSLAFIEAYIQEQVLPLYANTHTTTTITAQQTTSFRNEARSIIRGAVNASMEHDVVIFAGSGCTGAIHKLINALYLEKLEERPLVFACGQEHHSNLLPWREAGCEMATMADLPTGEINFDDLERKLMDHRKLSKTRLIIGLFSAASNVSGILNDDLALTALMHKYGGLAFWDYAAAAPYVNIDMNPSVEQDEHNFCAKDAIYFSMHKFVGGPQTPGVLVAKKELFKNPVPHAGGGGTVLFVNDKTHLYVQKIEDREEGGTPAIIESIRAGLTMYVKENIGSEFIMTREEQLWQKAHDRLARMKNIVLIGPSEIPKLPIISFLVKCPSALGDGYLHHNFICFVLNDLFGIQARGGCACAGPYVEKLLGMTEEKIKDYVGLLQDPLNIPSHMNPYLNAGPFERLKPGFSRLCLPWFASDEEIDYILDALEMVAKDGWKLLPQYEFDTETGSLQHFSKTAHLDKKWLNDLDLYQESKFQRDSHDEQAESMAWPGLITEAQKAFESARSVARRINVPDQRSLFSGNANKLRWFILPYEAKQALLHPSSISSSRRIRAPFTPRKFQPVKTESHQVGIYSGNVKISPDLLKILMHRNTPLGRKFSGNPTNGNKMWFQKTFLPNLMGSKTMTMSKTNLHNPYAVHDDCTDDEEQQNRQYWKQQKHRQISLVK